jgi:type II secretory pathway pseudopilin PulG
MTLTQAKRIRAIAPNGFTIIELLVAATVTIVLAGLLVSITTGVLSTWNRTTGRLSTHNQAKIALDQIANDLQSLAFSRDGNVWLAATIQQDQSGSGDAGPSTASIWNPSYNVPAGGFGKPTSAAIGAASSLVLAPSSRKLEDYRFGHAGVWLRFFTREPDSMTDINNVSVLRAVGYQIARIPVRATSGANPVASPENYPDLRWALFRSRVRSTPFAGGSIQAANRSGFGVGYNIIAPEFTTTAAGGTNTSDPGNIRRPEKIPDLLANNVIDFGIRVYEKNPTTGDVELVFPTDRNYSNNRWCYLATNSTTATPPAPTNSGPAGANNIQRGAPVAFDIFLRVLTPDGVAKLQSLELGRLTVPAGLTGQEYWWEIALQNSQTFIRRVDLKVQSR